MHGLPVIRAAVATILLSVSVATGIARVVEPRNVVMVVLASAVPLATMGAGVAVLLVATVLARGDSPFFRWLLGIGIAVVVVQLWWFAPMVVGGQPPRPPGAVEVRAMSVNTLGGRAAVDQIVATARDEDVDVIVLTEVTDRGLADLLAAGIDRVLPFRHGDTERDGAGTMVFTRGAIVTARPIATSARGYVLTTLVRARPVVVVAAHPLGPGDVGVWRDDLAAVGDAARADGADLVIGDMNATADHRPYRRLLREAGLRDGAELANVGWEPTFPAGWIRRRLGVPLPALVQIDHVLVRKDGGADRVQTVAIDGTDHLGVLAEVWLPAGPSIDSR